MHTKSKFERVMVIDDNTIDIYITYQLMTRINFSAKIDQYTSVVKALEFLQENENNLSVLPQIIIVDIYMPLITGFEFMVEYDKLSADFKNQCKVYLVSSTIDENDIKRAKDNSNIVAFQEKAITKEFLNSIV